MATESLISMAQAFTGLPMNQLIGVPLLEACKANSMMAAAQTKYILETGFQALPDGDGFKYKPIEINLSLTRPLVTNTPAVDGNGDPMLDGDGNPVMTEVVSSETTDVGLPLVSSIPISMIGVDFVRIMFDMEVKSSYGRETTKKEESENSKSASLEAKLGFGGFSATIKGSVSYHSEKSFEEKEKFSKSNSARYNVEITARQQPLPQGLAVLLEAMAKNIGPYETTQ